MRPTVLILLGIAFFKPSQSLLYPGSSSLGLVASVSVPVLELLPERRMLVDWCFQMSYDLPSQLSSFYNIPIWPGKHSPKNRRRDLGALLSEVEYNWASLSKYNTTAFDGIHPSDFSAGELYNNLENILVSYGFHKSCLLRGVCELAKHPFDEEHRNVLTDIITFIMSPSQHEGFTTSDQRIRNAYETAERSGFLGENCGIIYIDCETSILNFITHTIFSNEP